MSLPPAVDAKASRYCSTVVVAVRKTLTQKKRDAHQTALLSMGEASADVTEWITTGFPEIDAMTGGGWPVGRSSEVMGPEAAGKSALMHRAIRACQLAGGFAVLNDYEKSLDKPKMKQLGIDPSRIIYNQPATIEDGTDIFRFYLNKFEADTPPGPVFMGWDSIAAGPPRAEVEEDSAHDAHVGDQARAMGRVFRAFTLRLQKCRVHMMFINQERDTIGGNPMFKSPSTPGGRAAKYYTSLRVRLTRVETVKRGDVATGYTIQAETKKCRLVPPHRKVLWCLDFRYGPSPELTLHKTLLDAGVLKVAGGGRYAAPFLLTPMDRDAWVAHLRANPAAFDAARAHAVDAVRAKMLVGPADDAADEADNPDVS